MRLTRRTRFAIWFVAFAALAVAAPHLPLAWGIGLAVALFAAGALIPARDCPVTPSADARKR
jgi:hypothetical protein